MASKTPIKIKGPRSLKSKLHRLAYELEHDASRVRAIGGNDHLADAVGAISSTLGKLARSIEDD